LRKLVYVYIFTKFASVIFKYFLWPFSILFGLLTELRYALYSIGFFKRYSPPVYSIVVGNIKAGGTGKTPMVLALAKELTKSKISFAILSRGYGRKSKGFKWVLNNNRADLFGDEPLLFKNKLPHLPVAVCENRAIAIQKIIEQYPNIQAILLDDAFQHFAIKPHFTIVLSEFSKPFFKDHPFPMGMLRENRNSSKRADTIVVSKCPSKLTLSEKSKIQTDIWKYSGDKNILFSKIKYNKITNPFTNKELIHNQTSILLCTGIANPKPLELYLTNKFDAIQTLNYPDHYSFVKNDIEKIEQLALTQNSMVVTTEKDWMRMNHELKESMRYKEKWFVIGIENKWENQQDFNKLMEHITKSILTFANHENK